MCFCTRRRSVRSSANSHEPAAKIPSNTITNVAIQLLSICQTPFFLFPQTRSDVLLRGLPVHATARSRVAVLDSHSKHLARLATFALTKPLSVSLAVSDLVLDLPKHVKQRVFWWDWSVLFWWANAFHLHSFALNNCPPSRSASSFSQRSGFRLISSALLR